LKDLQYSKAMSRNSIISIMFDRTYAEISNILMGLEGKVKDFSKMSVTCQASKDILKDLTPERRRQMIEEFTWLLTNPKDIRSKEGCQWADAVAGLKEIPLVDMMAQLKSDEKKQEEDEEKQDGGRMVTMKSRMKSLHIVSNVLSAAEKCDCMDADYEHLRICFSKAIASLFDEVKILYQPVYGVIENCMKKNRVKKNKIILPLLQLLNLSNHFIGSRKEAYGIYRIKQPGKHLRAYLTSQLQCISSTLDNMTPAEQRKYHDVQKELSPFVVTSLPKRKAVASSTKGVIIPVVQFVTLDGNLIIPPFEQFYRKGSESEKEQYFQVMTDFFTKDNIYMIYSKTDEVPLKFYDISLPSIGITDSYIPVTDYDCKRIVEHHVLQDFCTFVPHATYTNAELVLSIFIALKEKRIK